MMQLPKCVLERRKKKRRTMKTIRQAAKRRLREALRTKAQA